MIPLKKSVQASCASRFGVYVTSDASAICRNCTHFRPNKGFAAPQDRVQQGLCTHITSQRVDIVTGEVFFYTARDMRGDDGACGLNAKYFEHEKDIMVFLREYL
jgi:hypothetical protein